MEHINLSPQTTPIQARTFKNMEEQFSWSRALLYIHGFLTEAENLKVKKRLEAWVKEQSEKK